MKKLGKTEIEKIVNYLKKGKPLPEDYKTVLFDTKKECGQRAGRGYSC